MIGIFELVAFLLVVHFFLSWVLSRHVFSGAQNLDDESLILSDADAQGGEDCGKNVSRGTRKKKIGPKRLTSGVKDHGKDRVEWRGGCGGNSNDSPRGCVGKASLYIKSSHRFWPCAMESRNISGKSLSHLEAKEREDKQFSQRLEFFTQVQTAFSRRRCRRLLVVRCSERFP